VMAYCAILILPSSSTRYPPGLPLEGLRALLLVEVEVPAVLGTSPLPVVFVIVVVGLEPREGASNAELPVLVEVVVGRDCCDGSVPAVPGGVLMLSACMPKH
jgi:hypothetical protein